MAKKKYVEKECPDCAVYKHVIQEIWWMARRYAHGRMTYAVEEFNSAIRLAQKKGMEFRPDPIDGLIEAKDGQFDKEWFEQQKNK
jgi:hypothetical protein